MTFKNTLFKHINLTLFLLVFALLLSSCYKKKVSYSRERIDVFPNMYYNYNNSIAIMYPAGVYGREMLWHFIGKGIINSGYYVTPSDYTRQLVLDADIDGDTLWERREDANPQLKSLLGCDVAIYTKLLNFNVVGSNLGAYFMVELRQVSTGTLLAKIKCRAAVFPHICFESCSIYKTEKDKDGNSKRVKDEECERRHKACDAENNCNRAYVARNSDWLLSNEISAAVSKAFSIFPKGPYNNNYLFDAHDSITIQIGEEDDGIDYSYLSTEEFMDNLEAVSIREVRACGGY